MTSVCGRLPYIAVHKRPSFFLLSANKPKTQIGSLDAVARIRTLPTPLITQRNHAVGTTAAVDNRRPIPLCTSRKAASRPASPELYATVTATHPFTVSAVQTCQANGKTCHIYSSRCSSVLNLTFWCSTDNHRKGFGRPACVLPSVSLSPFICQYFLFWCAAMYAAPLIVHAHFVILPCKRREKARKGNGAWA